MLTITKKITPKQHTNFQDPNLISHLSRAKQKVWEALKSQHKDIEDSEFRVDNSQLGNSLGYSRTTIYYALKTLVSGNLLKKVREVRGRGNHSVFQLLWSFTPENETPPDYTTCSRPTPRSIAKDSPTYRYFAAQYRRICEKSPKLKNHQRGIVGKLLKKLQGKSYELWESAEIFFRRKVNEHMDLTGFFVWLSDYLDPEIARAQRKANQPWNKPKNQQLPEDSGEPSGDPPKLRDFASFEAYGKAYDQYLDESG